MLLLVGIIIGCFSLVSTSFICVFTEEKAIMEYKKGLAIVDDAMRIDVFGKECQGPDWDKARILFKKMEQNKVSLQQRMGKLGK